MNLQKSLGVGAPPPVRPDEVSLEYINLKLASLGHALVDRDGTDRLARVAEDLLARFRQGQRLLSEHLCPADARIQDWLDSYLSGTDAGARLPSQTFVLDRHGTARALSLPLDRDEYHSPVGSSYRIRQGVLHNPAKDRRTTQGVFHIARGGLPVPRDKIEVPRETFGRMLAAALSPPGDLLRLPFTDGRDDPAECFVSLLLRPLVLPEIPGRLPGKRTEIRFFAPGSLVSNLDFVESIFGNAGDPFLPENDAALDPERWTGHTGCVILAPHLVSITKKEAGLPHASEADPVLRESGFCWEDPSEPYNQGRAFKLCARDHRGVMVTLISDNYFGYCKKEVKTQISFSANLHGMAEEEHAGGTLAFPSYDLGEDFSGHLHVRRTGHSFAEVREKHAPLMRLDPRGFGIDRRFPDIYYVPEDVAFDLNRQRVSWSGGRHEIPLQPSITYIRPSGYKVEMIKPGGNRAWRLVGTVSEGIVCHKPCTVSGGGKSEISKPITDALIYGPVFVADIRRDLERVSELIGRDYSGRFRDPGRSDSRPVLSFDRSLGSVIKLLTPSRTLYTDEYNRWLESLPQYLKELVFVVKRFYRSEWGEDWRSRFSVDIVNGTPGNELKRDNARLVTARLRVGFDAEGLWRTFGLRKDFQPARKCSLEDDITASVVVPSSWLDHAAPGQEGISVKVIQNCESRFFQRPDDAIHRGYDKQAEADLGSEGSFLSNFEPLGRKEAARLMEDAIGFARFTAPMQDLIRGAAREESPSWFVSSAHPRVVDGRPSKNPRYLQLRPDLKDPRSYHIARVGQRLQRRLPHDAPIPSVVGCVVPGRRNNPPDRVSGIRPLSLYSPIHYMELPEYLIEVICSMTGKSPSTTGAGSEGALTKGPFNALPPVIDLNTMVISSVLTRSHAFLTAAGVVGPRARVDHDVSLLVPELWCRMSPRERDPRYLIDMDFLAPCRDMEHQGRTLPFSLFGYRITRRFAVAFCGRVFSHPDAVFTPEMLEPEIQDMDVFAESIDNAVATQRRVAGLYFEDGSVELACPPLRAILHIMKEGSYQGKGIGDPEVRSLFSPEEVLRSSWYHRRLESQQRHDVALWKDRIAYLEKFLGDRSQADEARRLDISGRLERARSRLDQVSGPDHLKWLEGTLGREEIDRWASFRNARS